MSSNLKVKLNTKAVKNQLLKSSEMKSILNELAEEITRNYGEGAEVSTHYGKNRLNVSVSADLQGASDGNALLKAMR